MFHCVKLDVVKHNEIVIQIFNLIELFFYPNQKQHTNKNPPRYSFKHSGLVEKEQATRRLDEIEMRKLPKSLIL